MTSVQLLDKTEVWIRDIHLHAANLPALAVAAARVLNLPEDKVFVTDVRDGVVVFDVLVSRVNLADVTAKQAELLAAVSRVEGVTLGPNAHVHSDGILGVIGANRANADAFLAGAARLQSQIASYAARQVAVVSTGGEIQSGQVEDTNFLAIRDALSACGYDVSYAGVAGDTEREIAGLFARLSGEGYGLIISTGGVGAEDKDRTIEALTLLDPGLATAVLATYRVGHGRHVKDSVRIGVGQLGWSRLIALPGPTHEVKIALKVIVEELQRAPSHEALAEAIAAPLRASLPRHAHD